MPVLTIGDQFPAYELPAVVAGNLKDVEASKPEDYFTTVSSQVPAGTWRVVFFWPKDFTFVCPTEIAAFGDLYEEFKDRDCEVVGISTDNEYTHYAWRRSHDKLQNLPFPMAADLKRELVTALGVLNADGVCDRATFIVDPNNTIQFVCVDAGSVGRNTEEVLRQLDALQSDELCACNWQAGAATIDALNEMKG
ncbi:Alkyl hydroperoxide reductase subunit C [Actinomyces bovis]|uniref:Alkyl hydroperoxide reductase subunit C n=1 Tax=Actinomyces bovis TaxID=1658 RepID=A0ABY1VQT0_9ACTO|nr:peroxiredoxin [Actinomyces bovis]SPT54279.1 Alkyl hydroperoxide reductase subunit C [Actinomyces bovis]VEG56396.1 Alkyl hydroperoxide reductase subunit C [Actinomyces israelii]